jgi:hypothetical protein
VPRSRDQPRHIVTCPWGSTAGHTERLVEHHARDPSVAGEKHESRVKRMPGGSSYPVTQQSYDTATVPLVPNGSSEALKHSSSARVGSGIDIACC